MTAIDNARRNLFRALEANGSILRENFLWQAATALDDAGFPAWATLAEAAAQRTGGDDRAVSDLLFEIDCVVSRAPAPPQAERLTDWEPRLVVSGHRCVRCRDGERPCVRGSPDRCEWPHAKE